MDRDAKKQQNDAHELERPTNTAFSSGANALADMPDVRIAPQTAREENSDGTAEDSPEPAARAASRISRRVIGLVAAACFAVLCVVGGGIAYASGWMGGSVEPTPVVQEASPADKAAASAKQESTQQTPSNNSESDVASQGVGASGVEGAAPSADQGKAEAESASAAAQGVAPEGVAPEAANIPEATPAPAPAPAPAPQPDTVTVSVYVDSSRAAKYGYASCMASTSVTLNRGASVYDALCATGVAVGGSSSYVNSINGLAEFAFGNGGSGWLYFVNGSSPGYSCNAYTLNGGENISWIYTLDMGNDI